MLQAKRKFSPYLCSDFPPKKFAAMRTIFAANAFIFPITAVFLASAFIFIEKAQAQSAAPQASGNATFSPFVDAPKFAPARLRKEELNPNSQAPDTSSSDSADLQTPLDPDTVTVPPAALRLKRKAPAKADIQPELQPYRANSPTPKESDNPSQLQPFNISGASPALNIVPMPDRPAIPPPPNVPPLMPVGNSVARPPQAWRVKAYQLFKQKPDATSFALDLNASYTTAVAELRRTVEDEGLTVSGFNPTSGHVLITFSDLATNRTEKSIIALRPGLNATDNTQNNSTEIRVLCEARNRSLTQARMKEILARLQTKFGEMKTDANSL